MDKNMNRELSVNEKIIKIENSDDYNSAKPWFPPTYADEYYFVSYSHKDYKVVFKDIYELQNNDETPIHIWYDTDLKAGKSWETEARIHINNFNCKGVIFYISKNSVLSDSIHKEIDFVRKSGKPYLSINISLDGQLLSAAQLLKRLQPELPDGHEKLRILAETFNDEVTYISISDSPKVKAKKIKSSLLATPVLKFNQSFNLSVEAVNDINIVELTEKDFIYTDDKGKAQYASAISNLAFANCRVLEEVELPSSITQIGEYAFYNCSSLKSIKLPDLVRTVGEMAFKNCTGMESLVIGKYVNSIYKQAFAECTSLKNLTIPGGIEFIGSGAFFNCHNLESITVCNETVGHYHSSGNCLISSEKVLHLGCNSSVIPQDDSVTEISDNAFYGCCKLEQIVIPDSVGKIGAEAFYGCNGLKEITIPDSVLEVDHSAFGKCKNLKKIVLGKGLKTISGYMFCDCNSLENIVIPNGVTTISNLAFSDCKMLKTVTLPDSIEHIRFSAFAMCLSLTDFVIPDSVTYIDDYAFWNCTALQRIVLGNGIKGLGRGIFNGCTVLKDIYFRGTKEQWIKISGYFWDMGLKNYTLHCIDGDIVKE